MRTLVVRHKWLSVFVTVAVLASIWFGAGMLRPKPAKAFTLVETPAAIFAPVVISSSQSARMCTNNLLGDGSVRVMFEFRSHNDANIVLAHSDFMEVAPQGGACFEIGGGTLTQGGGTVGLIGLLRTAAGNTWGARMFPLTSMQINFADGTSDTLLPAVQGNFRLPAVQAPR